MLVLLLIIKLFELSNVVCSSTPQPSSVLKINLISSSVNKPFFLQNILKQIIISIKRLSEK